MSRVRFADSPRIAAAFALVVLAVVLLPTVAVAAGMAVKSGTYVGNGLDNRSIFVGFQPDVVIIDVDTAAIYESVIAYSGATPVPIPLREENGFAFGAEDVLAKITPRTRLIILNSPANPTGGVVPRREIEALVKGLERHPRVAIMSDEIYDQILYDGHEHASPSARRRQGRHPHA